MEKQKDLPIKQEEKSDEYDDEKEAPQSSTEKVQYYIITHPNISDTVSPTLW